MTLRAERLRPIPTVPSLQANDPCPRAKRWLMEGIVSVATARFGVTSWELIGPCRQTQLIRARAFVTWALRSLGPPLSYPMIGSLLGGRDHSTVIHLHERAVALRLRDPAFKAACDELAARYSQIEGGTHAVCH